MQLRSGLICRGALGIACFGLSFGIVDVPSYAAQDGQGDQVTVDMVDASLSGSEQQAWRNLSVDQKNATVRILNESEFGNPGAMADMEGRHSELDVAVSSSSPSDEVTVASGERESWVQQDWKIFGITYTSATTRMGYTYQDSKVVSVERCYGSYYNYVPLRSIDHNSWSSIDANGRATCKTEWSLSRPLQGTVYGTQGLQVDGDGNILQTWEV